MYACVLSNAPLLGANHTDVVRVFGSPWTGETHTPDITRVWVLLVSFSRALVSPPEFYRDNPSITHSSVFCFELNLAFTCRVGGRGVARACV